MKGFTTAEAQARTEATMCKKGNWTSSSATLTSMRGKKQTRKQRKIVSIILVKRISSRRCADWAAFKAEFLASEAFWRLVMALKKKMIKVIHKSPISKTFDSSWPSPMLNAIKCTKKDYVQRMKAITRSLRTPSPPSIVKLSILK